MANWLRKVRLPILPTLILGCLFAFLVPVLLFVLFAFVVSWVRFEERLAEKQIETLTPEMVELGVIDQMIEEHSILNVRRYTSVGGEELQGYELADFRMDIDEDGVEDLNDGHSVRASKTEQEYDFGPSGPTSSGFDDIDGDGVIDTWCCDPADVCVRVIWGTTPGEFGKHQSLGPFPVSSKGAFFDVDNDGDLDIVVKTDEKVVADKIVSITPEYRWIELERK